MRCSTRPRSSAGIAALAFTSRPADAGRIASVLGSRRGRFVAVVMGAGELVVLYREADMPGAPERVDIGALEGRPLVTLAASGPIGHLFTAEVQARGITLDEVVSARTFHIATALVRLGVGLTVVDNFTALASLTPGLAMRPLANPLRFDVNAMYLHDRPPTALSSDFLKALARKIEAISAA